jgi:hypothetical protein
MPPISAINCCTATLVAKVAIFLFFMVLTNRNFKDVETTARIPGRRPPFSYSTVFAGFGLLDPEIKVPY